MNLYLQENFKQLTVSHEFDKIRQKNYKENTKKTFKNSTKLVVVMELQHREKHFFHAELISDENTVMQIGGGLR
jgi:hypothetical protein